MNRNFLILVAQIICAMSLLLNAGIAAQQPQSFMKTNRLDGDGWLIATDNQNQGREEKWFAAPRPEAKPTAVPGALQEAFPNYFGLVWYWKSF